MSFGGNNWSNTGNPFQPSQPVTSTSEEKGIFSRASQSTPNVFGAPGPPSEQRRIFPSSSQSTSNVFGALGGKGLFPSYSQSTPTVFGGSVPTSEGKGMFLNASQSSTNVFGTKRGPPPAFGTHKVFGETTSQHGGTTSSMFGVHTQQSGSFTQSNPPITSTSVFGGSLNQQTSQPPNFNAPMFGQQSTTQGGGFNSSQMGEPKSQSLRGSTQMAPFTSEQKPPPSYPSSLFGVKSTQDQPNPSKSIFMGNQPQFPTPNIPSSSGVTQISPQSTFGQATKRTGPLSQPTTIFGQTSGASATSLFGIKSPAHKNPIKSSIFMSNPPQDEGKSTKQFSSLFGAQSSSQAAQKPIFGTEVSPTGQMSKFSPRDGGLRRKRSLDEGNLSQNPFISSPEDLHQRPPESGSKRRSMQSFTQDKQALTHYDPKRPLVNPSMGSIQGAKKTFTRKQGDAIVQRIRRLSASISDQAAAVTSTAIVCHDIPQHMNEKEILREHFSKFGQVLRINMKERNAAAVTFKSHESAKVAKAEGAVISEDAPPMKIYFKKLRKSTDRPGKDISPIYKPPQPNPSGAQRLPVGHRPLSRVKTQKSSICAPIKRSRSPMPIYAKTDDEKVAVLEKIDLLLRKQVVKQSDIKKAKVTNGTCPDMCPEKERYLRQQRKLLAGYEMDEGRIDHYRAIKEYSRSSADQEEPLAHELRPARTLQITMNYILCEIIPSIHEGSISDWYDFIWNRTRAIRKELTIQQINDENAIEINEQCARFHIFCAHNFCEEDRMNFAPKINNENLEKTMKTILDLYVDLYFNDSAQTESITSLDGSNVAEFYAYYILLNINRTADVLNELQELHPVVRSSPSVGLAVEVFMAIHSNNYAKFFKIVKKASYLQGCILHRYFAQVRRRAALTMAKAFTATNKIVSFPIDDFMRVLCFNDDNDMNIFCQHHSLQVCDGIVELNRGGIEEQEGSAIEMRSDIVSRKIQIENLGEIIANHELVAEEHVPYSSFDENGRYIGEYSALLSASDTAPESFQALTNAPEIAGPSEQAALPPGMSNNLVKLLAKELFHEVIDKMCLDLSTDILQSIHCTFILKEVLDDVILLGERDICNEVIQDGFKEKERRLAEEAEKRREIEEEKRKKEAEEREEERRRQEREMERKQELERKKKEKEKIKMEQSAIIASQLQAIVEDDIIKLVATETHDEEQKALRQQRIDSWSIEEQNDVINIVMTSLLFEDCSQIIIEMKKQKCKEIFHEVQTRKLERSFERWKKVKEAKVRFQTAKRTFPSVPYSQPISDQIRALLPNQRARSGPRKRSSFPLDNTAEASLRSPMNIVESRNKFRKFLTETVNTLSDLYKEATEPLPFCDIIRRNLVEIDRYRDIWWKIVISLPESKSEEHETLVNWLRKKFIGDEKKFKLFETKKKNHEDPNVGVCCRQILNEFTREDLVGCTGFVLVLLPPSGENDERQFWLQARNNIEKFISHKPAVPPVCLLILTLGWDIEIDDLELKLGLPMLDFAFSQYAMYNLSIGADSFLQNNLDLLNGVKYLAENTPAPPQLTTLSLREFFEKEITTRYITPLYRHLAQRQQLQMPPLEGAYQVQFYNSVIESLSGATNSEDFREISWPPHEFLESLEKGSNLPQKDWNSESTLSGNLEAMLNCQIPPFPDFKEDLTEQEMIDSILDYADIVCPNSSTLQSALRQKIKVEFERMYDNIDLMSDFDESMNEKSYVNMIWWHSIIDCIISQHLTDLLYHSPIGNVKITFPINALDMFEMSPEFEKLFSEIEFDSINEIHDLEIQQKMTLRNQENFDVSEIEESTFNRSKIDTSWIQMDEKTEMELESEQLYEEVKNERKLNSEYEKRLQALLDEGNAPLGLAESNLLSISLLPQN